MKKIIKVMETVKIYHTILVHYEDENQLSNGLDHAEKTDNLDDYIDDLDKFVDVIIVNENTNQESQDIQYFDEQEVK